LIARGRWTKDIVENIFLKLKIFFYETFGKKIPRKKNLFIDVITIEKY